MKAPTMAQLEARLKRLKLPKPTGDITFDELSCLSHDELKVKAARIGIDLDQLIQTVFEEREYGPFLFECRRLWEELGIPDPGEEKYGNDQQLLAHSVYLTGLKQEREQQTKSITPIEGESNEVSATGR